MRIKFICLEREGFYPLKAYTFFILQKKKKKPIHFSKMGCIGIHYSGKTNTTLIKNSSLECHWRVKMMAFKPINNQKPCGEYDGHIFQDT